ncbi:DUF1911 domain-containing protein [Limnobaculum zhutongyuii]|uniref:DUF1911 domain-containing protein n=1 Tax=Limnobaculum zhutongyuii TaxID=2498113 RepID=A0A411WQX9_9GAMM|nr:PoNe immunity protein domain-containing protein [Limnobaculum zhutongyuii]QBH98608.1 DUF1911 domain-containing protein [Limnobaculum zhutongyuii]TQS86890.1 DUF1911 domain-containing protein [Limnobaculum zhutongyuii]
MSEFEQKIRQKLITEQHYYRYLQRYNYLLESMEKAKIGVKRPYMGPFLELAYEKLCFDYTVGEPITSLIPYMENIIQYTNQSLVIVNEDGEKVWQESQVTIDVYNKMAEKELLPNLLGLCILFERTDWLETIVSAISPIDDEITIDVLIAMKIPDYPITDEKSPGIFSFRRPLLKAILATTEKETLKHLDDYLNRWYKGMKRLVGEYIDSHLYQGTDICGFFGYWAFDAAAVAYLKNIDDSSLYKYLYYPKDMVSYAHSKRDCK